MTMKNFLIRFGGFILIALAAFPLYAIIFHLMIKLGMMPDIEGFGNILTERVVYVWAGTLILGGIAIFVQKSWAKIFYFSPLYAPSVFAAVFTLLN